jgi:hypothetical protein
VAAQVDQRIDDELSGAVVGDLTAAVDPQDGNGARIEHVLGVRIHAEREHGRMLDEPDLIERCRAATVREFLHRPQAGRVVHETQAANRRSGAHQTVRRLSSPALLRASACSAR